MQLKQRGTSSDYDIFVNKADEFHALKLKLIAFINEKQKQMIAQTEQSAK